jgi:hypothetical protein
MPSHSLLLSVLVMNPPLQLTGTVVFARACGISVQEGAPLVLCASMLNDLAQALQVVEEGEGGMALCQTVEDSQVMQH